VCSRLVLSRFALAQIPQGCDEEREEERPMVGRLPSSDKRRAMDGPRGSAGAREGAAHSAKLSMRWPLLR